MIILVVAAVNSNGEGYFECSYIPEPIDLPGGGSLRLMFDTPNVPVPDVQYNAKYEQSEFSNKTGVRFVESVMASGGRSPMHATSSVDLGRWRSVYSEGSEPRLGEQDLGTSKTGNGTGGSAIARDGDSI
ncbi:hypothetical protein B7463_g8660, partial [Scytalidium lignicola]